jgi:hypothetical protein
MRARTIAVAIVTAMSLAAFSPATAQAPPAAVTIQATVTQFFPTFSGFWQASGAINDSGTFLRTELHTTGSLASSPVVGAFQAEALFTGSKGTFTLREELLGTIFQPSDPRSGLTGQWQIASGTGAYGNLSGHGTLEFVFPMILYSGVIP